MDITAPAGLVSLKPCPWCGKPLYSRAVRVNPLAVCVTEGCYGRKMPVVSLDVPSDVAAWNTRAPAEPTERVRMLEAALSQIKYQTDMMWAIAIAEGALHGGNAYSATPRPDRVEKCIDAPEA